MNLKSEDQFYNFCSALKKSSVSQNHNPIPPPPPHLIFLKFEQYLSIMNMYHVFDLANHARKGLHVMAILAYEIYEILLL